MLVGVVRKIQRGFEYSALSFRFNGKLELQASLGRIREENILRKKMGKRIVLYHHIFWGRQEKGRERP